MNNAPTSTLTRPTSTHDVPADVLAVLPEGTLLDSADRLLIPSPDQVDHFSVFSNWRGEHGAGLVSNIEQRQRWSGRARSSWEAASGPHIELKPADTELPEWERDLLTAYPSLVGAVLDTDRDPEPPLGSQVRWTPNGRSTGSGAIYTREALGWRSNRANREVRRWGDGNFVGGTPNYTLIRIGEAPVETPAEAPVGPMFTIGQEIRPQTDPEPPVGTRMVLRPGDLGRERYADGWGDTGADRAHYIDFCYWGSGPYTITHLSGVVVETPAEPETIDAGRVVEVALGSAKHNLGVAQRRAVEQALIDLGVAERKVVAVEGKTIAVAEVRELGLKLKGEYGWCDALESALRDMGIDPHPPAPVVPVAVGDVLENVADVERVTTAGVMLRNDIGLVTRTPEGFRYVTGSCQFPANEISRPLTVVYVPEATS